MVKLAERVFKHGGEGLAEISAWLMATNGAAETSQIQVVIEVPHGPVVETLERAFKVPASILNKWIASAITKLWRAARTTIATPK